MAREDGHAGAVLMAFVLGAVSGAAVHHEQRSAAQPGT